MTQLGLLSDIIRVEAYLMFAAVGADEPEEAEENEEEEEEEVDDEEAWDEEDEYDDDYGYYY